MGKKQNSFLPIRLVISLFLILSFRSVIAGPKTITSLACSPATGSVVLNEVNTKANPDYVELYFLSNTTIAANSWYLWVDVSQEIAVPAGSYSAGDYLLLNVNLNPSNQEVMLVSTSADSLTSSAAVAVDYLGYGGAGNFHPNWSVPTTCGTVYANHSANQEVIDRLPDGTGGWADHGDSATPAASNDGSTASCTLGSFSVQAQAYALACPNTRASVSLAALCVDGTTKSDYAGTVNLSLNQASAVIYTASSGGSPINQAIFDGTEGGTQTFYVYDNNEHTTSLTASDGAVFGSDSIDFRAYGFLASNIPNINACTLHTARLTAYGQNSTASGCDVIEGFSGSKSLKAWFDYLQPNTNSYGTPLVLIDANGSRPLPTAQPGANNITLDFSNGVANLPLSYRDAGQLQVYLRYDQAPYDNSEFSPMLASSNAFTVTPDSYQLHAYTMLGDVDLNNTTHSGTPRWPAGNDFRLQIQAQCADGTRLPNYQPSDAEMWLEMSLPAGMNPGTLTLKGNSYLSAYTEPVSWVDISSLFASGIIADSTLDYADARFSEVGVMRLHLRDANYLGSAIAEQTLTVGRFTPAYLQVTGTHDGQLQPACTSYTYAGESMTYASQPALTITARNAQGATVQNYSGSFMKLTNADGGSVTLSAPTEDGTQLGADASNHTDLSAVLNSNLLNILDNVDGSVTYPLSNLDSFTYTRNANALIAAYNSDVDLLLTAIMDGDGISDDGTPVTLAPVGAEIRFGRLVVDDAYGPQTDDLALPVRAEFFDGSDFIDNTDDYCTLITPTAAVSLSNWQGNLSSGETSVSGTSGLLAGSGEILLSAPGVGAGSDTSDGSVDLTLNLSTTSPLQTWLLNDENGDGVYAENPSGTASFGMYRGDDRFLYWRETQ